MNFLAELKRRNVIRVGVAWLALSWLLAAMGALLFPALGLPVAGVRWILLPCLAAWLPVLYLAWRYQLGPGGVVRDRGVEHDTPQREFTARRLDLLIAVVVLAALSLALIRQFISEVAPTPSAPAASPVAVAVVVPPAAIDPHSLAVLPLANLSPEISDSYFADGLSEELLNVLARIDGLKVTSRTSSFMFRDQAIDSREIATRLGVAYLLEGSVRRQGEDLRISVQLVEAATDTQRWSATFERRIDDIFRVQEEIAQSVADALVTSLGVRQVQVAAPTSDLRAYEWYLRGRQLFAQRGSNLAVARELLERAVERDPRFADAWATLAATWYVWRSYAPAPAGIDTLARAEAAAARALAINPRHPTALAVSARLAGDAGDRLRHAELIKQALALEPNNANSWLWQGLGLLEVGHIQAAHASFTQAQQLDPLSGLHLGWLGISTALQGDLQAGVDMLRRAHGMGWRGPASRALFFLTDPADAAISKAYSDWLHDDDGMPAAQRELARGLTSALSDPAELPSARQRLLAAARDEPALEWSVLLQTFGQDEAALAHALLTERASTQTLLFNLWYPQFRSFREHKQFAEVAKRHGLLAYWQQHGAPDGCFLVRSEAGLLSCTR